MQSPLFILCPGRSFSSVVCTALGQHPDLYDVPEIYLGLTDSLGELLDRANERGKRYFAYGLVRVIAQLHEQNQSEDSAQAAWAWLRERRHWQTGWLYHYIADAIAPRRLVDKSPTHGRPENLERLRILFPNASFLHLLRHPHATAQSLYRVHAQRSRQYPPNQLRSVAQRVEQQWLKVHSHIAAFSARLPMGQVLRLQGEALLADPDIYFPQIAEWLEIRTDAVAIAAMKHPEQSPYACPGPPSAPYGNNPGFLEDPYLRIGCPATGTLDAPLDWAESGFLTAETVALARQWGYR